MRTGSPRLGYLLVLIGVVAFSFNAGVSRIVLTNGVNAWTLAQLRAIGAAVLLFLLIAVTGRMARLRIDRKHWPIMVVYGLVGLGLLQSLYFEAIARIPIGLAILIEYLAPLWVALWARFVQRKQVRPILWPALVITFVGLSIAAGAQLSDLDPIGLASAFGASLCFALYFIVGERMVADHDPFVVSFWGFTIASVGWMVAALFIGQITEPWSVDYAAAADLPAALGAGAISMGLLLLLLITMGTVLPFAAGTAAMIWVPATVVSILAMLEPVGSALVGWWWFGESFTAVQLLGAVLVLTGITMALLSRTEHPSPAPIE